MKTRAEILANWETEQYNEWCAIDSYDPISGTTRRLFVGTEQEASRRMASYYAAPSDTAQDDFYRCSYISPADALAFFKGEVDELPDERGMYDVTTTAGMLDVSRQRVHQLLQDGKLEGRKVGKTWYVYLHSVEERMEG